MAGTLEHAQTLTDDELMALLSKPTLAGLARPVMLCSNALGQAPAFEAFPKPKCAVAELYAGWCGPCKAVVPATKRMSEQDRAARLHIVQASCCSVFACSYILLSLTCPPHALQVCAERCEVLPLAK